MAFFVRIFSYSGVVAALQPQVVQQSADSVFMLRDPYTFVCPKLQSNGATEVASPPLPAGTKVLRVEVDDGATIRYEMRMGANNRTAGTNSPALSGQNVIFASDGAVFAFVDAAAV
jgi:hypothetical protein